MIIGGGRKFADSTNKISIKKECISPLLMYNHNQTPEGKMEFDEFSSLALERFSCKLNQLYKISFMSSYSFFI